MPPWMLGWSVFTRPPSISAAPVTSSTGTTVIPASASVRAVPPDDTISTPAARSREANSTKFDLSWTEISARSTGKGLIRPPYHLVSFHLDGPGSQRLDHRREDLVLSLLYAGVERLLVVVGPHHDRHLGDDRPVVYLLVDEVHRHPGDPDPVLQRLGHRVGPRETRQERRMDVEDPVREPPDRLRSEDAHETRQHHHLGCGGAHRLAHRMGERLPVPFERDHSGRDTCVLGPLECPNARTIRHHQDDAVAPLTIQECLEVRSGTRNEDGDVDGGFPVSENGECRYRVARSNDSAGGGGHRMEIEQVPAAEWKTWVEENDAVILDVREPAEWQLGTLPDAVRIRLADLPASVGTLDASRPTLVVCRSGNRSQQAALFLKLSGFERPANLAGGVKA